MLSLPKLRFGSLVFFSLILAGCGSNPDALKLCFTGDLLLDRGVRQQINVHGAAWLFDSVRKVFTQNDYVIANLECPVTNSRQPVNKRYIFRGEPGWLKDVKSAGISHLVMANNHTYDQGRNGIKDTYNNLLKYGLTAIGYGANQESACEPVLIKKGNVTAAIFSSVLLPLENWVYLPDSTGVCQATVNDLKENINMYKNSHKNVRIIVVLHWGVEFRPDATLEQRHQARELLDAGADAIVGHHPHVVQQMEFYKGKPIYYSLGNFVFDQHYPAATKGLLLEMKITELTIECKEIKINISNCQPVPY